MDETKKKKLEEEGNPEEKPKDTPAPDEKADETKPEDKPKDEPDKPDDKPTDENDEGAKPEEKDAAEKPEKPDADEETPAPASDPKDEEILKLKTQIAAMQMGFMPECMEDAVVLAESYVKNGSEKDINSALSAVMKKYPDWKSGKDGKDDKSKGGFKVGAGDPDKKTTDDDKLNNAFGIKRKK